jgi:hypothetical protein
LKKGAGQKELKEVRAVHLDSQRISIALVIRKTSNALGALAPEHATVDSRLFVEAGLME